MKTKIILDDATEVVIHPYKLIEKKLNEYQFDGNQNSNRRYTYYILLTQNNTNDELWDNPFIHHETIEIKNLMLHDKNHKMYIIMKITTISKYEIDHIIDHLEMIVEGPGHYKMVRSDKSFYAAQGTPLLDFISFFRWTEGN